MQYNDTHERSEAGMALLITVVILLMVSAIGISALNRASDETAIAGSSRRKLTTLQAAEAGLSMVSDEFAVSSVVPQPVNNTSMIVDVTGLKTGVRTGTIDSSVPAQIIRVGQTRDTGVDSSGKSKGSELRITGGGSGNGWRYIYRVEVVATDPGGGNVQLQSQWSVRDSSGGGLGVY